jgi:hypothetical protein
VPEEFQIPDPSRVLARIPLLFLSSVTLCLHCQESALSG